MSNLKCVQRASEKRLQTSPGQDAFAALFFTRLMLQAENEKIVQNLEDRIDLLAVRFRGRVTHHCKWRDTCSLRARRIMV